MLESPYSLHPATGNNFIGRTDVLAAWRERLTPDSEPWQSAKSWMVIGAGGMGKTSLLYELIRIAKDEFKAHTISIDLGRLREIGDIGDLFATLSIEMPKAKLPGTKLRNWFGLQPNAPLSELVGQIAGELLNQSTSFAMGLAGAGAIKLANFREKPSEREGIAHRLAQFLVNLAILSEEQDTPVIVLLDQVGKCHDHPTWAYIAGMLLGLCKKMRSAGASQIFFVVSLRPEQEGLLRHQIDRRLFEKDIFIPVDLYPFSFDEAIDAIAVRGGSYIDTNLARRIVTEIHSQGPLDPYTIQLSSMAVWNYIIGDEDWHSPTEIEADTEKLRTIIKNGHAGIIDPFFRDPTLRDILIHLSQSEGGMTLSQLRSRLNAEHNLSTPEVKSAVDSLLSPPGTGYRLLTEIRRDNSSNLYILAHDLLKDYILSIIPDDQRLISQANRILEYGLWRYQETEAPLSDWELQLLWEVHIHLTFKPVLWDMIINSELLLGSPRLFFWYRNYPEDIKAICNNIFKSTGRNSTNIRLSLFLHFINSLFDYTHIQSGQKNWGAQDNRSPFGDPSAVEQLRETALSVLAELARTAKESLVSRRATEALGQLGEIALPILTDLALDYDSKDEQIRLTAASALGKLGEKKSALAILTELARTAKESLVRQGATRALGQLGEIALPVLTELARSDSDAHVRERATEALGQLGEIALPTLIELVQSKKDIHIVPYAAGALGKLGETALPVLTELTYSKDEEVRFIAASALEKLGNKERVVPILAELARNSKTHAVRQRATEALGKLDDKVGAFPILAELARSDKNNNIRQIATESLGQLGEIALPVLTKLARSDEDDQVRERATEALGQLGEIALPTLIELVRIEQSSDIRQRARQLLNSDVRERATEALGKLGDKGGVFPILAELARSDNDFHVRWSATRALGQFGEIALPVLTDLAFDYHGHELLHRRFAVICLGQLGEIALPTLIELIQSEQDNDIRLSAAQALAKLDDKKTALLVLTELINSDDETVRLTAALLLKQLGNTKKALPILAELARSSKDNSIRLRVMKALGECGEIALPFLVDLARTDKTNEMRKRATEVLAQLGDIANQELFTIALIDPFSEIGGIATIELIKNNLSEYFAEESSKLSNL